MPNYTCIFHDPRASKLYASCRHVDAPVLHAVGTLIWELCERVSLETGQENLGLVDAGVGSGRLFIPVLTSRPPTRSESMVIGLDVAQPMLDALAKNLHVNNGSPLGPYFVEKWDIQNSYPSFEVPIAVVFSLATFHILQRWKEALANAIKVLAENGRLVLIKEINQFMHQTEGFEGDVELEHVDETLSLFMREYHRLRSRFGLPFERSGVLYSDFRPAIRELKNFGFEYLEAINGPNFCWEKPHTYKEILLMLRERVITTWGTDLPIKERSAIADKLWDWLIDRRIDVDATFAVPARFEINVFGSLTSLGVA